MARLSVNRARKSALGGHHAELLKHTKQFELRMVLCLFSGPLPSPEKTNSSPLSPINELIMKSKKEDGKPVPVISIMAMSWQRQRLSITERSWYVIAPVAVLLVLLAGAYLYYEQLPAITKTPKSGPEVITQKSPPAPQLTSKKSTHSIVGKAPLISKKPPVKIMSSAPRQGIRTAAVKDVTELTLPLEENIQYGRDGMIYGASPDAQPGALPADTIDLTEEETEVMDRQAPDNLLSKEETVLEEEILTPQGAINAASQPSKLDSDTDLLKEEESTSASH